MPHSVRKGYAFPFSVSFASRLRLAGGIASKNLRPYGKA
jgi:hypothetical protein